MFKSLEPHEDAAKGTGADFSDVLNVLNCVL